MKILLIGQFADENTISKLNKLYVNEDKSEIGIIKYTRLIGEGFKHHIRLNITNLFLVPMASYPLCKVLIWKTPKTNGDNFIPFVNIIILKQLTIAFYVFYFSVKWFFQNRGNEKKIIVLSNVYLPFLVAIAPLKLLAKIYIVSFVPDMPAYIFSYVKQSSLLKKMLIPLYVKLSNKIINISDFYVYITKYMCDCFRNKCFCVIEGFTDINQDTIKKKYNCEKKAIMYAGALFEKFGIKLLLEAFHEIEGDYELWLFGKGDMSKEIELFSLKDPRIKYWGNLPNEEILEYEKKAKLLVNPRPTIFEFTQYSFPSKLMEYMASGTPVLTTKLLGIPDDYYDKMFFIDEETSDGLKKALLGCLLKSEKELESFGKNAQAYVLSEKNNYKQIGKLLEVFKKHLND